MAVYDEGSEACGMDLRKLCFEAPVEDLVATEVQQPVLVTASLAIEEAIRARGIHPDYVVGHSVGEFAALTAADTLSVKDAIALVRERGLAMAEAARERPGAMAAILGLADEVVENLCQKIHNVWPANYNCPGQLVISGSNDGIDEACVEAEREGARRAIKLKVSGAFHSPLVERAAERLKPAIERAHFAPAHSQFMSTVTAKLEPAQHYRELLLAQLTAGQVHAGGARADPAGRHDVRRGRSRKRAERFTEEDRQERQDLSGEQPEGSRRARERAWLSPSPRWRGSARSSPEDPAGSAPRSPRSWRARARRS
jgi:[acyl-carrier-protein] S-malonyltransferase